MESSGFTRKENTKRDDRGKRDYKNKEMRKQRSNSLKEEAAAAEEEENAPRMKPTVKNAGMIIQQVEIDSDDERPHNLNGKNDTKDTDNHEREGEEEEEEEEEGVVQVEEEKKEGPLKKSIHFDATADKHTKPSVGDAGAVRPRKPRTKSETDVDRLHEHDEDAAKPDAEKVASDGVEELDAKLKQLNLRREDFHMAVGKRSKPQAPKSAFIIFSKENAGVGKKNLEKLWKNAEDSTKTAYRSLAQKDQLRFAVQMQEWKALNEEKEKELSKKLAKKKGGKKGQVEDEDEGDLNKI